MYIVKLYYIFSRICRCNVCVYKERESSTIHLGRRKTGRRKRETETTIPRFRETRYLLSLALLFALSERLLLAREHDRSPVTRAKTVRGNRHYVIGRGFSLEIITNRCSCGRRCWRNEIIAEREDTNKYGSSFNPGMAGRLLHSTIKVAIFWYR